MVPRILIGLIGGLVAGRVFSRLRHGGCHGGGGCGGPHGGGRWRRGFGGFGGGPRMLFRLARELDLTPAQWSELEALWHKLRHDVDSLRFDRVRGVTDLAGAFGVDGFDRARVESAAARHTDAVSGIRTDLVDALARLHELLTPAQRATVRRILDERFGPATPPAGATPDAGPYR